MPELELPFTWELDPGLVIVELPELPVLELPDWFMVEPDWSVLVLLPAAVELPAGAKPCTCSPSIATIPCSRKPS